MESRVPPRYIPFDASKTDFLSLQLNLLPFLYPLANFIKRELAPSVTARVGTIHRVSDGDILGNPASDNPDSRKSSFVLCSVVGTARSIGYTGLSSQGGGGCPLSGLWPFVGRYTSCSAPYPLAAKRDGHEGPPQGGGSEPDAAAALLGLWLARAKDAPVQARARLYVEHAALNV